MRYNRAQIKMLAEKVKAQVGGDGVIGILGITYKPDTDVVEEAFGLLLAQELAKEGFRVSVFDPAATCGRRWNGYSSVRCAGFRRASASRNRM